MDYFAKRIIIVTGRQMSIAHLATLSLGQLQQLAHATNRIERV